MIMTVTELKQYVTTDISNKVLEARLQALELLVRGYTNNNFQKRAFRTVAVAVADGNQLLVPGAAPFKAGDTLEITESELNSGLVTVSAVSDGSITVMEELFDECFSGSLTTGTRLAYSLRPFPGTLSPISIWTGIIPAWAFPSPCWDF